MLRAEEATAVKFGDDCSNRVWVLGGGACVFVCVCVFFLLFFSFSCLSFLVC